MKPTLVSSFTATSGYALTPRFLDQQRASAAGENMKAAPARLLRRIVMFHGCLVALVLVFVVGCIGSKRRTSYLYWRRKRLFASFVPILVNDISKQEHAAIALSSRCMVLLRNSSLKLASSETSADSMWVSGADSPAATVRPGKMLSPYGGIAGRFSLGSVSQRRALTLVIFAWRVANIRDGTFSPKNVRGSGASGIVQS